MSKKQLSTRVDELEKRTGGDDDTRIFICWSDDGSMWVDGELLSADELKIRYPDMITVEWPDDIDTVVPVGINLERL